MKAATLVLCIIMLSERVLACGDPSIRRGSRWSSDVITYQKHPGEPLEAWEINLKWVDGVYLNYIRAPWGDSKFRGQPIQVCYVIGKKKKVIGISENKDRLLSALNIVLKDQVGFVNDNSKKWRCDTYDEIVERDPKYADLKTFVESI